MTVAVAPGADAALDFEDEALLALLRAEDQRQRGTLAMVASASAAPWQVLACSGSRLSNVTGEGYPGARFHSGCEVFDDIERLAVSRACGAFGSGFANVQPHSGSSANLAALVALLPDGGRILSMELKAGGHLSHGARASVTSRCFEVVHYGVAPDGLLDYDEVAAVAEACRPDVIICGASSYPRQIDFRRFRAVADRVGAWLLADISHIAGLVVTGLHPSPLPWAELTTTSTYKQLHGPRGGLVLGGLRTDPALARAVDRAVFPGVQGTPAANLVAAKAWALGHVQTSEFHDVCTRIRSTARVVADVLATRGHLLLSGGTDTHMVVVDLSPTQASGWVAEKALEECGLLVNRNAIPGDALPPATASGIRIGTNTLADRGGGDDEAAEAACIVADILEAVVAQGPRGYRLPASARASARKRVAKLCRRLEPVPAPAASLSAPEPARSEV